MSKISFLSGTIPPITGGEVYNYKLYSYLKDNNLNIEYINLHRIRLIFKLNTLPLVGDLLSNLLVFLLIFYRLGDVVIEDQYFSPYLTLTNFYHKFFKKGKNVLIVHHFDKYDSQVYTRTDKLWWNYPLGVIREISAVFFADRIVTNSQFNKQEILTIRSMEEDTIDVLPPGLDRSKLKNEDSGEIKDLLDGSKHIILCVGHCIPRKGIIYLVKAFSKVNDPKYKLCIVGKIDKDISYYHKVKLSLEELKLLDKVVLLNRVDQKTLADLYSQADFFVLPSLKEGFGIVLLEAMYYGLPIITTNVSAMPELVVNEENGLLVNAANVEDLTKALLTLIENPDMRKKMSDSAYQKINDSYYWEQTQSQFLSLVESLSTNY